MNRRQQGYTLGLAFFLLFPTISAAHAAAASINLVDARVCDDVMTVTTFFSATGFTDDTGDGEDRLAVEIWDNAQKVSAQEYTVSVGETLVITDVQTMTGAGIDEDGIGVYLMDYPAAKELDRRDPVRPVESCEALGDEEAVTYYLFVDALPSTVDPTLASSSDAVDLVENLFLGLTNLHPVTGEVVPELATAWQVSDDGLTWTFALRDDVPWVRYDPGAGVFEVLRPVTAHDFVYGIARMCRLTNAQYTYIHAPLIKGCDAALEAARTGAQSSEPVAVTAIDDYTLQVELNFPASYFLLQTTMWALRPIPREVVGDQSYRAGDCVATTGRDVINMRMGPGTNYTTAGQLRPGDTADIEAQATGDDGFRWWYLTNDAWVRDDAAEVQGECENIPDVAEKWTRPGNIITNGPYVLENWATAASYTLLRNPHIPDDLRGPGNIERVHVRAMDSFNRRFDFYMTHLSDNNAIPFDERRGFINARPGEVIIRSDQVVYYIGFASDKPPFDDVHVRRAFAAAIDRAAFVEEQREGWDLPMVHFAPPGIFGAPPLDEVGVGYDPDYARAELAEAGYPGCAGFPALKATLYYGQGWLRFAQRSWESVLGCPEDLVEVESVDSYSVFDEAVSGSLPAESRPHLWINGWRPDYPDENNWVGDVLWCGNLTDFNRPCSAVDDLIVQARATADPDTRLALYRRIESGFFGKEGSMPFAPLFVGNDYLVVKPWLTGPFETDGISGGEHYDWYTIDAHWQHACRIGALTGDSCIGIAPRAPFQ
ncbi:MAG: hypothetical protein JXB47_10040 [Anaerolineae bacterium]|nr:hypothetical protein [Anaerolineae bacterium]